MIVNTLSQLSICMTRENKTWANYKYECINRMWRSQSWKHVQLSSIIFHETRKHGNHQNYLIFKAYVCLIQTKVYIHIQTQRVHKIYAWRHVAQKDKHVYLIVWTR